jgi:hypothetical protein
VNKTVYIESSVISYLTAKPSRDLIVAAYQQITRDWWHSELYKYQCVISDFVMDEISRGDTNAASERVKTVRHFNKIGLNQTVLDLVRAYNEVLGIPAKAQYDLFHLAISVGNGVDYVLSWNFKHIANAFIREKVYYINSSLGLRTPTICTPEELIGGEI